MHVRSMSRTAFILVVGILAPFLCLSIDSVSAAPPHPLPHEHHRTDLIFLEVSTADGVCLDATSLPISHEPGIRLSVQVATWHPFEASEMHLLVVQTLPVLPDIDRALLQVYRL